MSPTSGIRTRVVLTVLLQFLVLNKSSGVDLPVHGAYVDSRGFIEGSFKCSCTADVNVTNTVTQNNTPSLTPCNYTSYNTYATVTGKDYNWTCDNLSEFALSVDTAGMVNGLTFVVRREYNTKDPGYCLILTAQKEVEKICKNRSTTATVITTSTTPATTTTTAAITSTQIGKVTTSTTGTTTTGTTTVTTISSTTTTSSAATTTPQPTNKSKTTKSTTTSTTTRTTTATSAETTTTTTPLSNIIKTTTISTIPTLSTGTPTTAATAAAITTAATPATATAAETTTTTPPPPSTLTKTTTISTIPTTSTGTPTTAATAAAAITTTARTTTERRITLQLMSTTITADNSTSSSTKRSSSSPGGKGISSLGEKRTSPELADQVAMDRQVIIGLVFGCLLGTLLIVAAIIGLCRQYYVIRRRRRGRGRRGRRDQDGNSANGSWRDAVLSSGKIAIPRSGTASLYKPSLDIMFAPVNYLPTYKLY